MKKRLSLVAVFALLVAVLTSCKSKYTIEFVEQDGTMIFETIEVREGKEIEMPAAPTKDGLTFGGWYVDPAYNEEFNATVMPAESFILYAKWNATLTFDSKGGSECNSITNVPGTFVTLPEPTKEGFVFGGWYTDEQYTNQQLSVVPGKHTTVYAKWQVKNTNTAYLFTNWRDNDGVYNITKDDNGTTITATDKKGEWSYAYDIINIDGTGYRVVELTFVGTKDCEAVIKLEGGNATATETRVKFTGEEQTLSWVVKPNNISKDPGEKLMIFLNAGNKGFVKTPAAEGVEETKFESAPYITIKSAALYQPQEIGATSDIYAIHFESNGGSAVASIFAKAGTDVTTKTPKKAGYIFGGWYTNAECTEEFDGKMPAQATILYAKWHEVVDMIEDKYSHKPFVALDFVYADGVLSVQKNEGTHGWHSILSKETVEVLANATKATVTIKGVAGEKILIKIGDHWQAEKTIECTGAEQTVEIPLTGITFEAGKPAVVIIPGVGTDGKTGKFEISGIKLDNNVDLAAAKLYCLDNMYENSLSATYDKGVLTVSKAEAIAGGEWWSVASSLLGKDIAGCGKLVVTVKGANNSKILFKVNDNNAAQREVTCTGEVQTVVLDFSHITLDGKKSAVYIFPEAGTPGTGAEFEISNLYFLREAELVNDAYESTLVKVEKADADKKIVYSYADGVLTIKKNANTHGWHSMLSNLKTDALTGATKATVTFKGVAGQQILFKIGDEGGALEAWETCTGEVQTKEISLVDAKFDPNKVAVVIIPGVSVDGETGVFEVSGIKLDNEQNTDLAAQGFTCADNLEEVTAVTTKYDNETGVLTVSKNAGAGEWEAAKTVALGDSLCYERAEITFKGAKDSKILFKINDNDAFQKEVVCTGEVQTIVIDFAKLNMNKKNAAVYILPECGSVGTGAKFEIYSINLSQYKALITDPISTNLLEDTYVSSGKVEEQACVEVTQANGVLTVKKVAGSEWETANGALTYEVLEGKNILKVEVKGTAGHKIFFKPNDSAQLEITCDGTVQYFEYEFEIGTYKEDKKALYIMPDAGTATWAEGYTAGVFEISLLEVANYKTKINVLQDSFKPNANTTAKLENGVLTVKKNTGQWDFIHTNMTSQALSGFNVLKVELSGTVAGEIVKFKLDDDNAYQFDVEIKEANKKIYAEFYYEMNAPKGNKAIYIMPKAGVEGESGEVTITRLEVAREYDHVSLMKGWTPNDAGSYVITETADSTKITKNEKWTNGEGEVVVTDWCFVKNTITGITADKYTTLVIEFTGSVAEQEIIFGLGAIEAKPFTTGAKQVVEIKVPEGKFVTNDTELKIFVNAGIAGSCDLVITDMYLK